MHVNVDIIRLHLLKIVCHNVFFLWCICFIVVFASANRQRGELRPSEGRVKKLGWEGVGRRCIRTTYISVRMTFLPLKLNSCCRPKLYLGDERAPAPPHSPYFVQTWFKMWYLHIHCNEWPWREAREHQSTCSALPCPALPVLFRDWGVLYCVFSWSCDVHLSPVYYFLAIGVTRRLVFQSLSQIPASTTHVLSLHTEACQLLLNVLNIQVKHLMNGMTYNFIMHSIHQ